MKTPSNARRDGAGPRVGIGRHSVGLPASRIARICLGIALLVGGVLGFLPIVGFWMVPLGLLVLSVDLASVRRVRRTMEVRAFRALKRWRARTS